jgi:hypothetical protein
MNAGYRVAAFRYAPHAVAGELSTMFYDLESAKRCQRGFIESGEYIKSETQIFRVDVNGWPYPPRHRK